MLDEMGSRGIPTPLKRERDFAATYEMRRTMPVIPALIFNLLALAALLIFH
jgi:hypothetical protein